MVDERPGLISIQGIHGLWYPISTSVWYVLWIILTWSIHGQLTDFVVWWEVVHILTNIYDWCMVHCSFCCLELSARIWYVSLSIVRKDIEYRSSGEHEKHSSCIRSSYEWIVPGKWSEPCSCEVWPIIGSTSIDNSSWVCSSCCESCRTTSHPSMSIIDNCKWWAEWCYSWWKIPSGSCCCFIWYSVLIYHSHLIDPICYIEWWCHLLEVVLWCNTCEYSSCRNARLGVIWQAKGMYVGCSGCIEYCSDNVIACSCDYSSCWWGFK